MAKAGHKDKESPFERKLKDIEREKRRVQEEIKALSRAVKKGQPMNPSSGTPPAEGGAATASHSHTPSASAGGGDALFEWGASEAGSGQRDKKKAPVRGDERFANYFSTGGFKSPMPARKDRSVQRNKMIFMIIVGAILVFILFSALR